MRFSEREVHDISDVIGSIYETVVDADRWPEVVETVCRYLEGKASRIYWRDASSSKTQTFYSWGFDPDFLKVYPEKYLTMNPIYPASIFVKPGEVFASHDLVPAPEFQASRFFKEWVAPQGFLDAAIFNIERYQASAAAFTVITGQDYGPVDDKLRSRLGILAPHLQRAVLIGREMNRQSLEARSLEAALDLVEAGVFLLDHTGRVAWFNAAAADLIEKGDMVRNGASGLSLAGQQADRQLREALSTSQGEQDDLLLRRPAVIKMTDGEGGDWFGCLMRLQPHTHTQQAFEKVERSAHSAFFVRRAEVVATSGVEACAKLHGLTPGEIKVLNAVIETDTVAEIADELGLSINTVKKHLSSIFGKFGVSRRSALIKAVMAAQGM
ncbi:helix-turn-helix transcriptional regulator [Oryzibacter oryziterrae]|uniref:helix-turn-helix transcriptional regulator n=1 Tax=Oryzibacter oryziterrae TaxID=2766474 RepID=UPI001F428F60|nr:helix-turn-helix transcriptional regulator [Oryzibacter oryziterrae]